MIDLAHNEAGLEALLEIMNGIRPPHGRLLLGVGTAGDRGDEVFVRLGEIAGLGADVVEIVHKAKYLRGRSMDGISKLITEGAAHAGMDDRPRARQRAGWSGVVGRSGARRRRGRDHDSSRS